MTVTSSRLRPALTVVLLFAGLPMDSPAAKPQFELRYKFEPNQYVHYEVTHEMVLDTRNGDGAETVRNETFTRKHYRVVSVDESGNAVLEPTIDRIRFLVRFNDDAPVEWDSASEIGAPQGFEALSRSIRKPQARMKVDSRGNLLSVVRLQSAAHADPAADADPRHNFLLVLPKEPVEIGGNWDQELRVQVSVPELKKLKRTVRIGRTFTLKSVEDNVAFIEFESSILTPVNEGAVRAQLIQRAPSGAIEFDIERGVIASHSWEIDKREVGIFGPRSLMQARTKHAERTVTPKSVARKPIGPALPPAIAPQPR